MMKLVMTLILSAEPCVNVAVSAGSKLFSLRPSKPALKTMAGLEQEPKSSAARRTRRDWRMDTGTGVRALGFVAAEKPRPELKTSAAA